MHKDERARGEAAARRGDPAGTSRTEDHLSGRLLDGRYRVGPRIARGGMASVYEAVDTRLDRTVAVKVMHPGLGDATTQEDSFARRFVREAKAAAGLSHPNVVAVYDQGRDEAGDGTTYLVMEYVPGHTLRDTITKEAPMSPERALAILDPVLSALGSAHRAGLIHRDVKPENVLIADDGRIKVADFGLAKAVSAETQHTATNGVLIGTVSYLAPELVVEQRADARADVYAAGVILFELLTGTKPHTGETPIAVAYRHVHHDVPPPSSVVPGLPAYVDALVARATTRDPSLRPADATVLLHHVHRVAQALHDGVREDPELVADLLPSARSVDGDTTPEPVGSLLAQAPGLLPAPTAPRAGTATRDTDGERTSVIPASAASPAERTARRPRQGAAPAAVAARPGPDGDHNGPGAAGAHGAGRRRSRRGLVLTLVVALVLAGLGAAGYWFGWGRYTSTPGVVGLEQAAAETKLDDAGLGATIEEVHSDNVAAGHVVSTDPRPGARILPGDDVTLTVSLGPEVYDVPDLAGLTVEDAEQSLAEVRMVLGRQVERWSETVPKGRVIRSRPAFGTDAAKALPVDTAVAVVVSKGRKPIKVGSWAGRDAEKLEKTLEGRGLQVKVVDTEYSDDVPQGHVISHTPKAGSTLYRGDEVELVVSKGPELVTVPSVRYSSTSSAVEKLEDLGFKVKKERASIYLSGQVAWDTEPGSGARVRKGSTIILYVV
ncbi:serine/threonine-protein kinase [Nocardioides sp. J9]|uniref:Stk1 family PASTA domain-containing Ser/Thr kinase n=1 Tax=Nocardioides sp. J9 TaxID=935844 RepID=UPI0011A4D2CD|nr:PASTA domain-containing protein [Nocardioides sp. J9]TWH01332.1 serine/threonine-protein kinase [Nocardioides sp. J9]